MKYIVNAFWKHEKPINAEEAIDYMMILEILLTTKNTFLKPFGIKLTNTRMVP